MIVGEFSDEEIKVMGSVYNYIMRKDVRNFGDEMWIHNCYNSSTCIRSFGQSDPHCHVPQSSLTSEECKNIQEAMNTRMYLNLLEPDPIMEDNEDYSFAIMSTNECELLSYTSDDNREYEYTRGIIDDKNIICNKFTEYSQ